MPELPEVETVVRAVRPRIRGKRIREVRIHDPKLKNRKLTQLSTRVAEVRRHGKYIIWDLESGDSLVIHLRMTGNLVWVHGRNHRPLGGAIINHSLADGSVIRPRCEFLCEGGSVLFADTRRFGTVELLSRAQVAKLPGVDPFGGQFSESIFLQILSTSQRSSRSQPIKPWLLRQDKVAGIGNIYASEILFDAKINPQRTVTSISKAEARRLFRSIVKILKKAIRHCGTTFSDFRGFDGESGEFQRLLKVYDRARAPCRLCKQPVAKSVQAGRSTFCCPSCQPIRP